MKLKILNVLLLIAFAIGIIGGGDLVLDEIKHRNVCPMLLGIPACYIIFTCFIIPFIVHILKKYNFIYFLFTGIAASIAFIATIMELTGKGECPKTSSGIPMCYYSLLIFSTLIVLKILIIKVNNKVE